MTIKELRNQAGMSQAEFAANFDIPKRTIQNWEWEGENKQGRKCPEYLLSLMEYKLTADGHRADLDRLYNYLIEHETTDTALMQNAGLKKLPSEIIDCLIRNE